MHSKMPIVAFAIAAMTVSAVLIAAVATIALAHQAAQTDWSAGGGVPGPVTAWQAGFDAAADVSWLSIPGQLALTGDPSPIMPLTNPLADRNNAYGIYACDLNEDGRIDILGTTNSDNTVEIWLNLGGSPPSWENQIVDANFPGGTAVHPADIDRDGDPDLVGSGQTPSHTVVWWRNDGGNPIQWTRFTIASVPVACNVWVADVDGDGWLDALSTSWSSDYIAWWRNEGGEPIQWSTYMLIRAGFDGAHSAWADDVDQDGDVDVVGTAALIHDVMLFLNNGDQPPTWTPVLVDGSMSLARYACMGDVDGDGLLDIAATGFGGFVRWYRNLGGTPAGFDLQTIDTSCSGGHYIRPADVDGDGHLDLVVAASNSSSVHWYRNDGNAPISWTKHVVHDAFADAVTAFPADVNGDGALDIIGASYSTGDFVWWSPCTFRSSGTLDGSILDLGVCPQSASLDWQAVLTPSTGLSLCLRAGSEPLALGAWSDPLTSPGDVTDLVDRYVQYRVVLESSHPFESPVLEELSLTWDAPLSVEAEPAPARAPMLRCVPNPVSGSGSLELELAEGGAVRLEIFDVGGRLCRTVASRTLARGRHAFPTPALPSGVYVCRLTADGRQSAIRRLVVVR